MSFIKIANIKLFKIVEYKSKKLIQGPYSFICSVCPSPKVLETTHGTRVAVQY